MVRKRAPILPHPIIVVIVVSRSTQKPAVPTAAVKVLLLCIGQWPSCSRLARPVKESSSLSLPVAHRDAPGKNQQKVCGVDLALCIASISSRFI